MSIIVDPELQRIIDKYNSDKVNIANRFGRFFREEMIRMSKEVKTTTLSGQVLGVVTGNLRRSISHTFKQAGTTFEGSVGTNVSYGIDWENGFKKITKSGFEATLKRPFLQPVFNRNKSLLEQKFIDKITELII